MPRVKRSERRKHLIIITIAVILAMIILLISTETASAQLSGLDFEQALTTERLMLLGMMLLVALTWLYLRWRPPPDYENEPDRE